MNPARLKARIRELAAAKGFAVVGFASAAPLEEGDVLENWLSKGFHARMKWMENHRARASPSAFLPGAKAVVVAGWNCFLSPARPGGGEGVIGRYAFGPDYHSFIGKKLEEILGEMKAIAGCRGRVAVDASPLLERALGRRAGLGWIGRNSCLVNPRFSSWLLLGEIVTDAELPADPPLAGNRCGTCYRCMSACPTGAIVEPGLVDSRRCISYLTIENKGEIPRELRPLVGNRLFGCDLCQEACPWTRFAVPRTDVPAPVGPAAGEFLRIGEAEFKAKFAGTAILRAGRAGMARNAAVVLGNSPGNGSAASLAAALLDPEPLVRSHAAWALGRLGRLTELSARAKDETDERVREEMEYALGGA